MISPTIWQPWIASASEFLRRARRTAKQAANLMVGVPDYDAYLAHRRSHHPNEPILTRPEFVRNRMDSRYGVGTGRMTRCC
jgi:uncharacterized short protein YbdD (DUF466 family)